MAKRVCGSISGELRATISSTSSCLTDCQKPSKSISKYSGRFDLLLDGDVVSLITPLDRDEQTLFTLIQGQVFSISIVMNIAMYLLSGYRKTSVLFTRL